MPWAPTRVLPVVAVWLVALVLLYWARLPGVWRRGLALVASAAGLIFLLLAIGTEGLRESPTTAAFLLGAPYVAERTAASASLAYYVLTGICLLLGTAGLAVGDDLARALGRRWMASALGLSLAAIALRFTLEKAAAPPPLTWAVGVTWLAPAVGAFFVTNLRSEGKGAKSLLAALLLYGLVVRASVAGLYVGATALRLGSHYDLSPVVRVEAFLTHRVYRFDPGAGPGKLFYLGVLPQLAFWWPIYTVAAGLVGAGVARVVGSLGQRQGQGIKALSADVEMAAAGKD